MENILFTPHFRYQSLFTPILLHKESVSGSKTGTSWAYSDVMQSSAFFQAFAGPLHVPCCTYSILPKFTVESCENESIQDQCTSMHAYICIITVWLASFETAYRINGSNYQLVLIRLFGILIETEGFLHPYLISRPQVGNQCTSTKATFCQEVRGKKDIAEQHLLHSKSLVRTSKLLTCK